MLKLQYTNKFSKDFKKLEKQGNKKGINEFKKVIETLQKGEQLEQKYKDHKLHKNSEIEEGSRGCHLLFDLILVYVIKDGIILCEQIGDHHTLKGFKEELENVKIDEYGELTEMFGDDQQLVVEERGHIKDETILRYVKECVDVLANNGFDATMDDIECVSSDTTQSFGSMQCKKTPSGKYILTLSKHLFNEPEDTIKNTIYHELCHYLQYKKNLSDKIWALNYDGLNWGPYANSDNKRDSKGHGATWRRIADKVENITGQKISRTDTYDTHKEVGKAYDSKVKYIVKCNKCGNELTYTKMTDFVKNPNISHYDALIKKYGVDDFNYIFRNKSPEGLDMMKNDFYWSCGRCGSGGMWEVIKNER